MKLSDREFLELNELCGALVDGTLTATQRSRLQQWLGESEAARRYYVRAMGQSASLQTYAAEMHADLPGPRPARRPGVMLAWWVAGSLAAAAAAIVMWRGAGPAARDSAMSLPAAPSIARITAVKEARWAKSNAAPAPGALLYLGQRLELESGFAEVTFDSGARVLLAGATSLDLNSAWDATLRRGTLTARVPREAIGFRISNAAVDVVDLGTEFSMVANANGSAEVFVLQGEVEAAARASDDPAILLRENEARRFAASGVSDVRDRQSRFAQLPRPLALERFAPATRYLHWSFDEDAGGLFAADHAGQPVTGSEARMSATDDVVLAASHGRGKLSGALHCSGGAYASAHVPGLSGASPHTVSFWVRVPQGATTDAWMVSWGTTVKKLSSRPVQISWNRRPGEGPFGALRTDFGGGYAIGAHDLRDGRWHHIAVYFSADDATATPVQVKQYVDGRLESSLSTLTPGKTGTTPLTGDAARLDVVWLGRRLTGKQPERFRGELDELFIADRGLEPDEIVALLRDNRLPAASLAATGAVPRTPSVQ